MSAEGHGSVQERLRRVAGHTARGVGLRLDRLRWDGRTLIKYGRPRLLCTFGGGFGDHLLCTAIFRELRRRGHRGLWMMSNWPELFSGNSDVDAVLPDDPRSVALVERWGGRVVRLSYAPHIPGEDRDVPPPRHIIAHMCAQVGVPGQVSLRPYLQLSDDEKSRGQISSRQIAIQSSGLAARYAMRNKEWYVDRFQALVSALKSEHDFVQIGSSNDPGLEGALDMRGKTSFREAAAILSQSILFVGLVGFLMHLARAVECRAVIIYGGRESATQSGYCCNLNIGSDVPCAPCWQWSRCDHDRECMRRITAASVIEAIRTQAGGWGQVLPVESVVLP